MLDKDKWRLGHRRPWWQWNVLTLAAALFALIWSRELFELQHSVWPFCLLIFFLWLIIPVSISQPPRTPAGDSLRTDDESTVHHKSPTLRLAIWIVIIAIMFQILIRIAPLALR